MNTLLYAHLCEKAFLSQNGNLNLIGIFEEIYSQQFPIQFPQLSIVCTFKGQPANQEVSIRIKNKDNGEEISKPINIKMTPAPNQPDNPEATIRLIGDINNLQIKEAGNYAVEISLDGQLLKSVDFKAKEAPKPIPKNR